MKELGLSRTGIFLGRVTPELGWEKYLLLTLCWKLIHGPIPAHTQHPDDVPWRFHKGPNGRDLQRTFRGLLEDQQKNWSINEKSDAIVLVLHIYYCFLEKQVFKSSKSGRPRDVYRIQFRDVQGTKWWEVLGTSTEHRS